MKQLSHYKQHSACNFNPVIRFEFKLHHSKHVQFSSQNSTDYTLNQVFCHKQSFVYLLFYLYNIGKIENKQRFVCNRIPGSRYTIIYKCLLTEEQSNKGLHCLPYCLHLLHHYVKSICLNLQQSFVCLFDLMPCIHGKQLRSCRDGHLLNHTVLGKPPRGSLPVQSAHSFASN